MAEGEALLKMALSRPVEALAAADRLIARRPAAGPISFAHQARAIVLRDAGRLDEAIAAARLALRRALASGDPARATDVRATLGVALVMNGRTRAGLAELDAAVAASDGQLAGRVLTRRGIELASLGRRQQALADLNRAITLLHRARDHVWEARARTARFLVYGIIGQAARADRDLAVAERLFAAAGQELESAMVVQNRADVAVQAGDLPGALACLDEAAKRYDRLGLHLPDLVFDRCKALLAAGLTDEALAEADAGVARLARRSSDRAKLLFVAARAAQAAGRPDGAAKRAQAAHDLFRAQGRPWWTARAAFVLVQSRYDAGLRGGRIAARAARIADRLDELGAEEAPAAHLLAGRLAAESGRMADADRYLARAARFRRRGPTYGHAAGWLAQALRADAAGRTGAALNACRRGLLAAGEHQRRLGAVELRVHAAAYGTELAAIGARHALRRGDPRMLLLWSERWRASALVPMSPPPPDDGELAADLAALREVMNRLDSGLAGGGPTASLEQDRRRLEASIRARTRRAAGAARPDDPTPARAAADEILGRLDGDTLVELVAVDGVLHAITARSGRVRLHTVGPVDAAVREVELARFMLRRLARGRPPPDSLAHLAEAGRLLQARLLGQAAADLNGGPVILAPPGPLHGVPWGMLPALLGVPWSVAPSAALALRARRSRAPRGRRTVIVVGPGLRGSRAEAARIATGYPGAVILANGQATAARVLAAVDGAYTAHIAAHGIFRADNPLFSSLRLDDGPLTVYDLGRLRRAPHRLILSSCESGVAAPVAGDELLGMISVLAPLGTTSLLASTVPVNDASAAPLMADFHAALGSGQPFADALLHARSRAAGEPVALATALAFIALGG
ncbi:CHAT domain-containing protein [Actinoplanes sp. ATCC 53533]|uniref:CHAT domain-containing protein n=1 Tax=Actinoplanes sp. ATCC 53533 TaxID=1288362 RepID=UPI000F78D97B|nr:CHAT domain-containing protein [Actinoplanes sp. ATCC 53533]RSM42780.1 CHAT domain-containing protein [Actinoplanes sp. ATCC 53533]